jgi:hypothetical protein
MESEACEANSAVPLHMYCGVASCISMRKEDLERGESDMESKKDKEKTRYDWAPTQTASSLGALTPSGVRMKAILITRRLLVTFVYVRCLMLLRYAGCPPIGCSRPTARNILLTYHLQIQGRGRLCGVRSGNDFTHSWLCDQPVDTARSPLSNAFVPPIQIAIANHTTGVGLFIVVALPPVLELDWNISYGKDEHVQFEIISSPCQAPTSSLHVVTPDPCLFLPVGIMFFGEHVQAYR